MVIGSAPSGTNNPLWGDDALTQIHEQEHINQRMRARQSRYSSEELSYHETPAVLSELTHAGQAAAKALAPQNPLLSDLPQPKLDQIKVPLTPGYQPSLDWLRREALRHGHVGGTKTMTELLNTPMGQQWLKMQHDELTLPRVKGSSENPLLRGFPVTEKQAGLFYRDIEPEAVSIRISDEDQPKPSDSDYFVGAEKYREPRWLTSFWDNPKHDFDEPINAAIDRMEAPDAFKAHPYSPHVAFANSLLHSKPQRYRPPQETALLQFLAGHLEEGDHNSVVVPPPLHKQVAGQNIDPKLNKLLKTFPAPKKKPMKKQSLADVALLGGLPGALLGAAQAPKDHKAEGAARGNSRGLGTVWGGAMGALGGGILGGAAGHSLLRPDLIGGQHADGLILGALGGAAAGALGGGTAGYHLANPGTPSWESGEMPEDYRNRLLMHAGLTSGGIGTIPGAIGGGLLARQFGWNPELAGLGGSLATGVPAAVLGALVANKHIPKATSKKKPEEKPKKRTPVYGEDYDEGKEKQASICSFIGALTAKKEAADNSGFLGAATKSLAGAGKGLLSGLANPGGAAMSGAQSLMGGKSPAAPAPAAPGGQWGTRTMQAQLPPRPASPDPYGLNTYKTNQRPSAVQGQPGVMPRGGINNQAVSPGTFAQPGSMPRGGINNQAVSPGTFAPHTVPVPVQGGFEAYLDRAKKPQPQTVQGGFESRLGGSAAPKKYMQQIR